jgi:hypothetical protein
MTAADARRGLARHQLPEGTRAVLTQRIDGRVAISDVPVDHAARVYLMSFSTRAVSRSETAGSPR